MYYQRIGSYMLGRWSKDSLAPKGPNHYYEFSSSQQTMSIKTIWLIVIKLTLDWYQMTTTQQDVSQMMINPFQERGSTPNESDTVPPGIYKNRALNGRRKYDRYW